MSDVTRSRRPHSDALSTEHRREVWSNSRRSRASDRKWRIGKEGIFTNLGDSCLLLELFVEVFVGLHVRQSMFFKSIPSPSKEKGREREGNTQVYTPHRLDPSLARAEETIRGSINMGIYMHNMR